jgi:hypothetical protein
MFVMADAAALGSLPQEASVMLNVFDPKRASDLYPLS